MDRYTDIRTAVLQDLDVDPDCPITSDMDGPAVAKVFLAKSLLKKRETWGPGDIARQERAALALFCESNDACGAWTWQPDAWGDDLFEGELKAFLADLLDPQHEPDQCFGFRQLAELMEPGPGAARGANAENFYTKLFASPLTATSSYLFALYRATVCERPGWAEAEFTRLDRYGRHDEIVEGSSYFSVPKNEEIQRSCATEPNINMLFQKGLGRWMESRMEARLNLSLTDQKPINQQLARAGSISGEYATIDLKSASDRNSMAMVERFFPPNIVKWVKLFRSPSCRLPDGSELKMEMCSSMGNGFTFPLQTALFVGVVATCYKLLGIPFKRNRIATPRNCEFDPRKEAGTFAVFGDDIIVRREAYEYVCQMLRKLGHVVNDSKSFNSGGFRESCGGDYFRGYNVRGVYIRRLETPLDVYSAINRLTRWEAAHGVNLSLTLRLLLGWVKFLPVPFAAADHEGVKVPYDATRTISLRKGDWKVARDASNWQSSVYRGCQVLTQRRVVPALMEVGQKPTETNAMDDDSAFRAEAGWFVTALGGYAGTPPYRLYVADRQVSLDFGPPSPFPIFDGQRPAVEVGVRPKSDERVRWKVKVACAQWVTVPNFAGPQGEDRGEAWERFAGRLEFLSLLPRE